MSGNIIEAIAVAWLHHQGYTDEELATVPRGEVDRQTHEAMGCEHLGAEAGWWCFDDDERPNHPVWDAAIQAGEIANVVVEALGLPEDFQHEYPAARASGLSLPLPGPIIRRWVTQWGRVNG